MDGASNQSDHELRYADYLNRQTSSWNRKCKQCGGRFLRDRVYHDYEVCPECLERNRTERDVPKTEEQLLALEAERRARIEADWSNSILEICRNCGRSYKSALGNTAGAKVCPECQRREERNVNDDAK
jgi:hypothetical protein